MHWIRIYHLIAIFNNYKKLHTATKKGASDIGRPP